LDKKKEKKKKKKVVCQWAQREENKQTNDNCHDDLPKMQ
jgi:hypothetical protein